MEAASTSTEQNSRLQKNSRCSLYAIWHSLGTGSHSYQLGNARTFLKFKIPDASRGQPCKQDKKARFFSFPARWNQLGCAKSNSGCLGPTSWVSDSVGLWRGRVTRVAQELPEVVIHRQGWETLVGQSAFARVLSKRDHLQNTAHTSFLFLYSSPVISALPSVAASHLWRPTHTPFS